VGKPECLEKNLSRCHFVHRKPHTKWPEIECGPPRRERVATNCMSHDAVVCYYPYMFRLCSSIKQATENCLYLL